MFATRTGAAGSKSCQSLAYTSLQCLTGLQSLSRLATPCQAATMALPSQVSQQSNIRAITYSAFASSGINPVQRSGRTTTVVVKSSTVEVAETEQTTPVLEGFRQLGLSKQLQEALTAIRIDKPTEVQKLTIPGLKQGGDFLITSHTGSGKTLAYLLPIVQQLKEQELQGYVPAPKRPRVLVLGPTKELTEQITQVAKHLSHFAKIRVVCANSAGKSKSVQESRMAGFLDVVVASPTKLLQLIKEGNIFLRQVQWLVVDEADTLFAEGWGQELVEIIDPVKSKQDPANVVLVSATMTKPIKRLLSSQFPNIKSLETSSTHHAIAGSKHTFTTVPPGKDKIAMLFELLAPDARHSQKHIVFCNSVDSCRAVEHACREAGLPTVNYHGDMPVIARTESMRIFTSAASGTAQRVPIMIASDVAARGLDFEGHVDHVINFDFPYTSVDYIHRSGRTARAGRTGRITSIVTKRDKVLAQRVEWALQHNEPLDQLSSNPDILPPSQRPELKQKDSRSSDRGDDRRPDRRDGDRRGPRSTSRPSGPSRSAGGSGRSGSQATTGSRRGAGRVTLMQERLQARNEEKGKGSSRRPTSSGRSGGAGRSR